MKVAYLTGLLIGCVGCGEIRIGSTGAGGTASGGNEAGLGGAIGGGGQRAFGGALAAGGAIVSATGGAQGTVVAGFGGSDAGGALGGAPSEGGTSTEGGASTEGGTLNVSGGTSSAGAAGASTTPVCELPFTIQGRVTRPDGVPVAGVKLSLSGAREASTLSDASGAYAFTGLCPGVYAVAPSATARAFCAAPAASEFIAHDVREDFVTSSAGCDAEVLDVRLRVLIFDPPDENRRRLSARLGVEDPRTLVRRSVRAVETLSNGHVRYPSPSVTLVDDFPPSAALQDLVDSYELCPNRDKGLPEYDEVWLVGPAPLQRPAWEPMNCRRGIDVIGIDWQAGLGGLLQQLQRRSETVLSNTFSTGSESANVFRLFDQVSDGAPGGCGTAARAPNAALSGAFDDTRVVSSYCAAYLDDPFSAALLPRARELSCSDWFCNEFDYRRFWQQHLPKSNGIDADGHLRDWWRLSVRPDDRLMKLHDRTAVTCSESYASGWCEYLLDGKSGMCNDGEWAFSADHAHADFHFLDPRTVHAVTLYDRACVESVQSGHLEFSDGSEPVPFGALDEGGTRIEFSPRSVTRLRVVVEQTQGGNPGLAEVVIE